MAKRLAKIEAKKGDILEVEFDMLEKHFDGTTTLSIREGAFGFSYPVAEIPQGTLFVITELSAEPLVNKALKQVTIKCPKCRSLEQAVEDNTTIPFSTYIHTCKGCGYVIMESEWVTIKT